MLFSCRWLSVASPLVSRPTKLILSDGGSPGNIAKMLGRCDIAMPVELLAKEGDTCEIGDVASKSPGHNSSPTSVEVWTMGRRMHCVGMSVSSSRKGQKWAKRGLSAMSEAQIIPTLTSMADHVTAWMPDSIS